MITSVIQSLTAAAAATLIVLVAAAILGRNPGGIAAALVAGPLGSADRLCDALGRAVPLVLCGLAVTIAFRCQAWNIGAEGQYVAGAIVVAALGTQQIGLSGYLLLPLSLTAAAIAGGLFALPAAILENRRNVPIVLSTILLNFIAISLVTWLTQGPLRGGDPSAAQTDPIARQAYLPSLVAGTDLHWGFVIVLALAAGAWLLFNWSTAGFAMRMVGLNPEAAKWSGVRVERVRLQAMFLSGSLAGLAGGMQIAGVHHLLNIQAAEGFGYVGIAVALLGRLHPIGVLFAGVAIGMLDIGAAHLERQPQLGVPSDLAEIIKGVLILCVLVVSGPRLTGWFRILSAKRARRVAA